MIDATIGRTVGNYRISRLLGRGGMGNVYLAEHQRIERQVAIKVLHRKLAAQPEMVERFFNEALATNRIRHEGIIETYDCGVDEVVGAYLVLEFLPGETLDALQRRLPLEPRAACSVVQQVARALGAAHAAGIVHRDLKPGNIFLIQEPGADPGRGLRAKVVDFGVAKLLEGAAGVHTRVGEVMGTPRYMSPEQFEDARSVDHRTDIYSLGLIAYQLLCGRGPFDGLCGAELVHAHLFTTPEAPSRIAEHLPPVIDGVLLKAVAKVPAERFATMEAFATALDYYSRRSLRPAETFEFGCGLPAALGGVEGDLGGPVTGPPALPEADAKGGLTGTGARELEERTRELSPPTERTLSLPEQALELDGQASELPAPLLAERLQAGGSQPATESRPHAALLQDPVATTPARALPAALHDGSPDRLPVERTQVGGRRNVTLWRRRRQLLLLAGVVALTGTAAALASWIASPPTLAPSGSTRVSGRYEEPDAATASGEADGTVVAAIETAAGSIASADGTEADGDTESHDSAASAPVHETTQVRHGHTRLLWLSTLPEGAKVVAGAEVLGITPLVGVSVRGDRVLISKRGFAARELRLDVEHTELRYSGVRLRRLATRPARSRPPSTAAGKLQIVTLHRGRLVGGADILLDGRPVGQTPLYLERVAAGWHRITARHAGFETSSKRVWLAAGRTQRVVLRLR